MKPLVFLGSMIAALPVGAADVAHAATPSGGLPYPVFKALAPDVHQYYLVGDVVIRAKEITFDKTTRVLKCVGDVSMQLDSLTIRTSAATVEVGDKKVFGLATSLLNLDVIEGRQKPNKAPEPTTTAVTSPAAQEPRQP